MARFEYVALDARAGCEVTGVVEAPSAPGAALALRRQELFPIQLEARVAEARAPSRPLLGFTRRRDVVIFFRQLALMLRAGLTLLQALDDSQKTLSSGLGLASSFLMMKAAKTEIEKRAKAKFK